MAKIVTRVFRAVLPLLDTIWHETLSFMGRTWATDGTWLCSNSEGIVKALQRFNLSCMCYDECVHGLGWRAWNAVRLFTNIDQADLLARIADLLTRAWTKHLPTLNASAASHGSTATASTMLLQVFADGSAHA